MHGAALYHPEPERLATLVEALHALTHAHGDAASSCSCETLCPHTVRDDAACAHTRAATHLDHGAHARLAGGSVNVSVHDVTRGSSGCAARSRTSHDQSRSGRSCMLPRSYRSGEGLDLSWSCPLSPRCPQGSPLSRSACRRLPPCGASLHTSLQRSIRGFLWLHFGSTRHASHGMSAAAACARWGPEPACRVSIYAHASQPPPFTAAAVHNQDPQPRPWKRRR